MISETQKKNTNIQVKRENINLLRGAWGQEQSILCSTEDDDSAEQSLKAAVAIRLVAVFFERALLQLLQAIRTHKVLRVKFAEHGRNAPTC